MLAGGVRQHCVPKDFTCGDAGSPGFLDEPMLTPAIASAPIWCFPSWEGQALEERSNTKDEAGIFNAFARSAVQRCGASDGASKLDTHIRAQVSRDVIAQPQARAYVGQPAGLHCGGYVLHR